MLKDFCAKAATAKGREDPTIFESEYKGMQNSKGGVVGMLEVIESDYARLEADTKSAEASAQKEYDEFMDDSFNDKAKKAIDIEHKTAKKQDESQALQVAQENLAGTQEELDAALQSSTSSSRLALMQASATRTVWPAARILPEILNGKDIA